MTMLRSVLFALTAAACLFAFGWLGSVPGGPLVRALVGVTLGTLVTSLAYGQPTWVTVTVGALSPLAFVSIEDRSLGFAAAAMCFLWVAPRFLLAETRRTLAALVGASIVAAAVAGLIFAAYVDSPTSAHLASCIFAGSCLSLVGILIPVNT